MYSKNPGTQVREQNKVFDGGLQKDFSQSRGLPVVLSVVQARAVAGLFQNF